MYLWSVDYLIVLLSMHSRVEFFEVLSIDFIELTFILLNHIPVQQEDSWSIFNSIPSLNLFADRKYPLLGDIWASSFVEIFIIQWMLVDETISNSYFFSLYYRVSDARH